MALELTAECHVCHLPLTGPFVARSDGAAVVVAYLCHPVSGDVPGNIARAKAWLKRLQSEHPNRAFIAPWIAWLEMGDDDSDPAQRELGLRRDCAVAELCAEVWLVGPRVSSGMQRESEAAQAAGASVIDMTGWMDRDGLLTCRACERQREGKRDA